MIYDVTLPVYPGMFIFPGDPEVSFKKALNRAEDGAEVHSITLGTHTGTHVDAPSHMLEQGRTVDLIHLEALMGRARLHEIKDIMSIGPEMLVDLSIEKRLLIKTGYRPDKGVNYPYPCLTPEAARHLAESGILLIGLDTPSVDPPGQDLCHSIFLNADIVIVENINLHTVPPGEYSLYCLPMLLKGLDGAPARVLLEKL